jgi:hypothetical protein
LGYEVYNPLQNPCALKSHKWLTNTSSYNVK